MARLIAVLNQKGGVGKTTTTLALGAAIADRGHRVLLVDLDPQAGLTIASGLEPGELPATIAHSIAAPKTTSLAACLRPLGPSLTLVPASLELAAAEGKLQQAARREYVLAKLLRPLRSRYDFVFLDCPAALSLLTVNALTAANEVLIPVVPEYLAARGLRVVVDFVQHMQQAKLNPSLSIVGIVLTMVDHRTTHGRAIAESLRSHLGGRVGVLGEIKRSTKAAEAAAAGLPVTHYGPARAGVALGYERLADVLLAHWVMDTPLVQASHA